MNAYMYSIVVAANEMSLANYKYRMLYGTGWTRPIDFWKIHHFVAFGRSVFLLLLFHFLSYFYFTFENRSIQMYKCSVVKCENDGCSRHFYLDSHCKSHEKCMDLIRIHCIFVHLSECVTKKKNEMTCILNVQIIIRLFFSCTKMRWTEEKKNGTMEKKKDFVYNLNTKNTSLLRICIGSIFWTLFALQNQNISLYACSIFQNFSVEIESFFLLGIFLYYSKSVCLYFRMRNTIWLSFVFFLNLLLPKS